MIHRSLHALRDLRLLFGGSAALLVALVMSIPFVAPVDSAARSQDSDLSQMQRSTLKQIIGAARERRLSKRASGIGVLFACGENKEETAAAQVLARELGHDVYRVDLSKIVTKYIGETEKNLRRVFTRAEASHSILFFDEADALFGKRTEVKDSHDRYANIEINYLLKQIEKYDGLAIISTKRKESIDEAFLRRIRFVVEFQCRGGVSTGSGSDRVITWQT
jgi:SpoVK/Ycf46/Vps4 family AAA+-type ATPase